MTVQEYGPQTVHIEALIDRARHLTPREADELAAAWPAVWSAARSAARDAAWAAVWPAARSAARAGARAAWDAAGALVVRDLISTDHYDTLTRPWRTTIGRIHPDDPELTA